MDKDNAVSIKLSGPGGDTFVFYPKLYTLLDFMEKYGEDSMTIMLQDRERELYTKKAVDLANQLQGEADWAESAQTALDAWNPCDDRPPTEEEKVAAIVLAMAPQQQAVFKRHLQNGIAAEKEAEAKARAEEAAAEEAATKAKFAAQEDMGAPVTTPQQEPAPPASFEAIGQEQDQAKENAQAVQTAMAIQDADVQANAADFTAPTEFEEGGTEGVSAE